MATGAGGRSFWKTVPGMVSGTAGVLGAVAALIGALASIGVFADDGPSGTASPGGATLLDQMRLRWKVMTYPSFTRFSEADIRPVPAGARIEIRCHGERCFDGVRKRRVTEASLAFSIADDLPKLPPRGKLEIRVSHPTAGVKTWTFIGRRADLPDAQAACLPKREQIPRPC